MCVMSTEEGIYLTNWLTDSYENNTRNEFRVLCRFSSGIFEKKVNIDEIIFF